jgi:hypothetical protein
MLTVLFPRLRTRQLRYAVLPTNAVTFLEAEGSKYGPRRPVAVGTPVSSSSCPLDRRTRRTSSGSIESAKNHKKLWIVPLHRVRHRVAFTTFTILMTGDVRAWIYNVVDDNDHGMRLRLWTAATNGHIVHPRRGMWAWRTMVTISTVKTPDSSTAALWETYQQSHLVANQEEFGLRNIFVHTSKWYFTCCKLLRHGAEARRAAGVYRF